MFMPIVILFWVGMRYSAIYNMVGRFYMEDLFWTMADYCVVVIITEYQWHKVQLVNELTIICKGNSVIVFGRSAKHGGMARMSGLITNPSTNRAQRSLTLLTWLMQLPVTAMPKQPRSYVPTAMLNLTVGGVAQWLGCRSLAGVLSPIYGWHVTTSLVKCPIWVDQPGQLSLLSLHGW